MKKTWVLFLALFTMMALAACGSDNSSSDNEESASGSSDENWKPDQSIEVVAPSGAGGGWDTTARMAAEGFEEEGIIDQGLGVVNKEGGGGAIGWSYIAEKSGNPHHMFVGSPPLLLVPLNGQSEYGYEDFTPLANMISDYGAFAVHKDAPWDNLNELFDDMKDSPDDITVIGESSPGSMDHIQFVKIAKAAGVDPKSVKYVSAQDGSTMTNLLNGNADVYSSGVTETIEQVRADKIRVLGVTSEERMEGDVVEDFPTAKEQGIDETFINWRGFFGPPDMSEAEIAYYEEKFAELNESEHWQETREKFAWNEMYMESEEYKEFLSEEKESMQELLDELNIQGE
ncbi:tripartite tricarboxylate transporter substrate binding protein [Salibacterium salarium]|uniref:Tripartite tricarboxylate transporter substrate binding protein n=1 Tax=Salibacterium salarium TaxID=284579 RepID=A0A3R9RCS8_9BACI|nr:tripartite tricarboxylate transporter substrate-binding protein [Salibacterium salarium]RSL32471.1 tripartite tricarboxylate transporter substrate binding protein [Salibacterium salarium]